MEDDRVDFGMVLKAGRSEKCGKVRVNRYGGGLRERFERGWSEKEDDSVEWGSQK
jgi:hypothetical protein